MKEAILRAETKEKTPKEKTASAPLTERQARLRALRAKSDAAIAAGMRTLTIEEINAEVAELRGNDGGGI